YPSEQQDWEPPDWPPHLPDPAPDESPPPDEGPGQDPELDPPPDPDWDLESGLPPDPGLDPDTDLTEDPFPDWQVFMEGHEFPSADTERPPWPPHLEHTVKAVSLAEALVAAFLAAPDDVRA
ncbi:hypothetical protein QK291_05955, partial [Arthrobacter sp. AL12]|nr:hypothetical protein [Arthrobacter sp. AL12]